MHPLLKGELFLTVDIVVGLFLAEVILRLRLDEVIMRRFVPKNIPPVTALAVAISAGSSKAGAAVIASSFSRGEISENSAIWSVLMLPLPSYLKRWPSTFTLSVSMAGLAGGIFALSLLIRSIVRFIIALHFLRKEKTQYPEKNQTPENTAKSTKIFARSLKTLPLAWLMFGIAYVLAPVADGYLRGKFAGSFLPLSGWTVAAGSIAHVSAALSMAGGAMASGELRTSQAVFALILGSGLGTASRLLRQNAGYYYGLFPKNIATKMILMNFATIMPLIAVNLLFAGLALSLSS